MIWYSGGELISLGIDRSLAGRHRRRLESEGLVAKAFPDNPRSALLWHPLAVEFLLHRVGKQGRPFATYTDEETAAMKAAWETHHTYISVANVIGVIDSTAKSIVERGLLDDEPKDIAMTRYRKKQTTGKVMTVKLSTPPPYNVGDEVECEVGFRGYTKMDLFGKVMSVQDDRVNVSVGHMEMPVTIMLDAWQYEVEIK